MPNILLPFTVLPQRVGATQGRRLLATGCGVRGGRPVPSRWCNHCTRCQDAGPGGWWRTQNRAVPARRGAERPRSRAHILTEPRSLVPVSGRPHPGTVGRKRGVWCASEGRGGKETPALTRPPRGPGVPCPRGGRARPLVLPMDYRCLPAPGRCADPRLWSRYVARVDACLTSPGQRGHL